MSRPAILFTRSLALAALVGGLVASPNLYAATSKSGVTSTPSYPSAESPMKDTSMSPEERIEERVKELHDKLKITPDQAAAWDAVATTMRDNEKNVHALIRERHEKDETQTAIEDLESYQRIAAAHADSLGKFIQVFQPLYNSMPEAQKKNADTVFGTYEGRTAAGGKRSGKNK